LSEAASTPADLVSGPTKGASNRSRFQPSTIIPPTIDHHSSNHQGPHIHRRQSSISVIILFHPLY
jgi:hypothetical protein